MACDQQNLVVRNIVGLDWGSTNVQYQWNVQIHHELIHNNINDGLVIGAKDGFEFLIQDQFCNHNLTK